MKKAYFLFIAVICFITTGCLKEYKKEDIMKKYSDYWKYSLGDYTYTVKDIDNGGDAGGLSKTYYKIFNINFKDSKSQNRSISLTNDYTDFDWEIKNAVGSYIRTEVDSIAANSNVINTNGINVSKSYSVSLDVIDSSIKLYDSNKGVKFKDLSVKNLADNNLKLKLKIDVSLSETIDKYPNIKDILFSYVKEFYALNNNIETQFFIKEPTTNYSYNKKLILTYSNSQYNWEFNN